MIHRIKDADELVRLTDLEREDWQMPESQGREITFRPNIDPPNVVSCDEVSGDLGCLIVDPKTSQVWAISFIAAGDEGFTEITSYFRKFEGLSSKMVYLCGLGHDGHTNDGNGGIVSLDASKTLRDVVTRLLSEEGVSSDRVSTFWNEEYCGMAELMYIPPRYRSPSGERVKSGVYVYTDVDCDPSY